MDPENEAYAIDANGAQETDSAAWTPSEEGIANGLPKTKTVLQVRGAQDSSQRCMLFMYSHAWSKNSFDGL